MFAYFRKALAMMPPEVGDPYESLLQRSFFDDADWGNTDTSGTARTASGGALFDVLEARSRLVASNGKRVADRLPVQQPPSPAPPRRSSRR